MPTKLNSPAGSFWSVGLLCRPNRILVGRTQILRLRHMTKGGIVVPMSDRFSYTTTRPTINQWKRYNRFWRGIFVKSGYDLQYKRAERLNMIHLFLMCDDSARESFLETLDKIFPEIL